MYDDYVIIAFVFLVIFCFIIVIVSGLINHTHTVDEIERDIDNLEKTSVQSFIDKHTQRVNFILGSGFEVSYWQYGAYYHPELVRVRCLTNNKEATMLLEISDLEDENDEVIHLHCEEVKKELTKDIQLDLFIPL